MPSMALFSELVTKSCHLVFTATCLAMKSHRPGLYGGNQEAALESLFCRFNEATVTIKLSGSLANSVRISSVHKSAPICHALLSDTT